MNQRDEGHDGLMMVGVFVLNLGGVKRFLSPSLTCLFSHTHKHLGAFWSTNEAEHLQIFYYGVVTDFQPSRSNSVASVCAPSVRHEALSWCLTHTIIMTQLNALCKNRN